MISAATLFLLSRPATTPEVQAALSAKLTIPNLDALWLNLDEEAGVERMRELPSWLAQKPIQEPVRTVILFPAEKLGIPAQNALLKTLEEPPAASRVMLITSQEYALLPTIRSRCQRQILELPAALPAQQKLRQTAQDLLTVLQSASTSQVLRTVSDWELKQKTEKRIHTLQLLETMLSLVHTQTLEEPNPEHLRQLRVLGTTIDAVRRNANLRLAMDWGCLRLAKRSSIR